MGNQPMATTRTKKAAAAVVGNSDTVKLWEALVAAVGSSGLTRLSYPDIAAAGGLKMRPERLSAAADYLLEHGHIQTRGPGYKAVGAPPPGAAAPKELPTPAPPHPPRSARSASSEPGARRSRSASRREPAAAKRTDSPTKQGPVVATPTPTAAAALASIPSPRRDAPSTPRREGVTAPPAETVDLAGSLMSVLGSLEKEVARVSEISAAIDDHVRDLNTLRDEQARRLLTLDALRSAVTDDSLGAYLDKYIRPAPTNVDEVVPARLARSSS
jgi:hypothetical protein